MDWIPWLTGRRIVEIVAARVWNGKTPQAPWFEDGAQIMLKLDNGGGVLGDVSYHMPDGCGYSLRHYWRLTVHGTGGVLETQCGDTDIMVATHADRKPRQVHGETLRTEGYFEDFLAEVRGRPGQAELTTEGVLRASELALLTQRAAHQGQFAVRV